MYNYITVHQLWKSPLPQKNTPTMENEMFTGHCSNFLSRVLCIFTFFDSERQNCSYSRRFWKLFKRAPSIFVLTSVISNSFIVEDVNFVKFRSKFPLIYSFRGEILFRNSLMFRYCNFQLFVSQVQYFLSQTVFRPI